MCTQSITEEWKTLKKRKGNARLMTIDGHAVLKENNYSLEQVAFLACPVHASPTHACGSLCMLPSVLHCLHTASVSQNPLSQEAGPFADGLLHAGIRGSRACLQGRQSGQQRLPQMAGASARCLA